MRRTNRSGVWNLIAVEILVRAAWYAWPSVLDRFEKAVKEATKGAVKETLKEKLSPW